MVALTLLFPALTFAAALTRRAGTDNGAAVNQGITNIDIAERALTDRVRAYNGGILEVNPILEAFTQIHYVNRVATNAANTSSPFTQAESKAIADNVNDSVGVSIPINLALLESKKPLFDAAQVSSIIGSYINLIRFDHETFSTAVGLRLTPDQLAYAGAGAGKIEAAFLAATAVYAPSVIVFST